MFGKLFFAEILTSERTSAQSLNALAEQNAVCTFFYLLRIDAVCCFLLRGCVLRPEDAYQKRFSWFPDLIQKVQKAVDFVDLEKC